MKEQGKGGTMAEYIIPAVTPGVHTDAIAAYESAKWVRDAADILIPLHDFSAGRKGRIP